MKKEEAKKSLSKTRVGEVVSDKMDNTVVVRVSRTLRHPVYSKVVRKYKKYYAHDKDNSTNVGDTVKIMETAPMSKLKRWRVVEVVKKAAIANN